MFGEERKEEEEEEEEDRRGMFSFWNHVFFWISRLFGMDYWTFIWISMVLGFLI